MYPQTYAFCDPLPFYQHQIHAPSHLLRFSPTGYPRYWHSLVASYQLAAALFLAVGGSTVPKCHLDATHENNGKPFSKVADHWEACARNNHFAEDRKCHSKSCASHVRVDDQFSLRLAGMVGFSTIVYHSGRLGKFVVIWSSGKFAQPLLF